MEATRQTNRNFQSKREEHMNEEKFILPERCEGDLWKTIYGIQGQAQQALEGGCECWTPEEAWKRVRKVLIATSIESTHNET